MNNPHPNEPQTDVRMNEGESLQERDLWAQDRLRAIHSRTLPCEDAQWRGVGEEELSIASVFYALMVIRKGKHHTLRPGSSLLSSDQFANYENFVEVDTPPESAVRIITRALQAGAKGEKLIKKALELKPRAKGAILARQIASKLTKPKGGWPKSEEDWERFNSDSVEWVKPFKRDVERELENLYPEIYESIPKKEGAGGKLLRSEFWDDAGLKDVLDQARGN